MNNQKISFSHKEGTIYIILSACKSSKWKQNLLLPLISLENQFNVNPSKMTELIRTDNSFHIFLENKSVIKNIEVFMDIVVNEKTYPWFHIRIKVVFNEKIQFDNTAPEIRMKLLPKYNSTEAVTINQPTRHTPPTDEWKSNDMPAAYVWNPDSRIETYFFLDFSKMNWMSPETFERFSIYECGTKVDGSFGLLNRIQLPKRIEIPANFEMIFDFFLSQNYRYEKPSKWEAVAALVSRCFTLISGYTPFPSNNLSWWKFSKGCITDLMKEELCWVDPNSPKYHAYVADKSEFNRRETIGKINTFETMTFFDLLPPWILYLQLHKNDSQMDHVKRTSKSLQSFIDPKTNFLYNNIQYDDFHGIRIMKPTKYSIGDSWYFFEPITRFAWFIRLIPLVPVHLNYISSLKKMINEVIRFVQGHNYEITAFYDPFSLKPLKDELDSDHKRKNALIKARGKKDILWKMKAKNFACLGIYLYIMIQAFYLFKEDRFLLEAKNAAKKLMKFSPDELFWEPLEIAYGIAGLTELYRITGNELHIESAYFNILNELRMFYWYDDNSFNWKGKRRTKGLVMACVGIRYPAMKENLESIYPWLIFLKVIINSTKIKFPIHGMLKFFNLIRINSFYYFSNVLNQEFIYPARWETPCKFIPFEDLEMLETPPHFSESQEIAPKGSRTGVIGREIYGSGEVIWLYLMFEALAKCNKPEIMLLNLDLFDFQALSIFPPLKLNFIAYNPVPRFLACKVIFMRIGNGFWTIEIKSLDIIEKRAKFKVTTDEATEGIPIDFEKEEAILIKATWSDS
ncbi:MAG: hypothetical protein JSW11_04025 [Candidatus Heimdallarchaeota archaeon]|nr:MAG: hypothetical protein JSW11_04025 [Candidatus Heimdallarchaeota archaeon]